MDNASSTANSIDNHDNIIISYNDNDVNKPQSEKSESQGNKTDDNINRFSKGGTSQDYLSRRIARDYPEVLGKIGKDKQFKSVRAAAIAVESDDLCKWMAEQAKQAKVEAGKLYGENHPKQELTEKIQEPQLNFPRIPLETFLK